MAVATMRPEAPPQFPAIKPGMMGMYIFLASEVMFFGSLFAMYFYLYGSHLQWPPPPPGGTNEFYVAVWPIPVINTIVLFSSAFTCHFAADAIAHDNRRRFFVLWTATIVLGLAFMRMGENSRPRVWQSRLRESSGSSRRTRLLKATSRSKMGGSRPA